MKRFTSLAAAVALVVAGSLAWAAESNNQASDQWFDMENCACCKHMGESMDMLMEIEWENHLIENGGLMTVVVPEEHKEQWEKVCEEIKSTEEKAASGEEMPLCNCCKSHMALMKAGAKIEEVKTDFGSVTLITSDKPEVVEKIQKHMKKTKEEAEKMMAMMEQQQ